MLTEKTMNLEQIFEEHNGRVVHKFPHHLRIYDRLFKPYRECKPGLAILEIGVAEGGSLELWRKYFGEKATIIGVDIQDKRAAAEDSGAEILVGDQGDPGFWALVAPQIGRPDIIIDDGSHFCKDQILTFKTLFPLLLDGGLYVVEDIHTSYRESYGGGPWNPNSFVEYLKRLIDGIHSSEYGGQGDAHIFSVQIYPNLAIIEKRAPHEWGGSTMRPA